MSSPRLLEHVGTNPVAFRALNLELELPQGSAMASSRRYPRQRRRPKEDAALPSVA
jgi:hypothetical protein